MIAGLTAAAAVIPKAYATIAGLPIQVGLYTSVKAQELAASGKLRRRNDDEQYGPLPWQLRRRTWHCPRTHHLLRHDRFRCLRDCGCRNVHSVLEAPSIGLLAVDKIGEPARLYKPSRQLLGRQARTLSNGLGQHLGLESGTLYS